MAVLQYKVMGMIGAITVQFPEGVSYKVSEYRSLTCFMRRFADECKNKFICWRSVLSTSLATTYKHELSYESAFNKIQSSRVDVSTEKPNVT